MVARGAPARRRVGCKLLVGVAFLVLVRGSGPAAAESLAPDTPIGVHSMLYLTQPFSAKQAMFKEAAAVGASTIRLDIELSGVFPNPAGPPDWSGVDQYMFLAELYHLRVLADLLAPPWYEVACPPGTSTSVSDTCPPGDPRRWGAQVALIAAHTRGVINYFEIVNEPDGRWAFLGSPQQYAAMLAASYSAIHFANPTAKVALGGLMNIGAGGQNWMNAVLAVATDTRPKFDIANIHVRTPPAVAGAVVSSWRRYFASKGFHGPLWVTETGYPADPSQQTYPGYRDGPPAQARYLDAAIPDMICAGAAKVFATERDALGGPYASEGFLQTPDPLPAFPAVTRRPSFYTIQQLASESRRRTGSSHRAFTRSRVRARRSAATPCQRLRGSRTIGPARRRHHASSD